MTSGPRVLVAVPAHDEADRIVACLDSVVTALAYALEHGAIAGAYVALAAHRCTDATVELARARLDSARTDHLLLVVDEPVSVGVVRARLISVALGGAGPVDWVFSTDADSRVPPTWVVDGLALAGAADADLVLGLVELDELAARDPARTGHDALVRRGLDGRGGHEHVYAANLLVRRSAYEAAGGFPDLAHGEEHGLARAVRATGGTVLSSTALVVRTSGRLEGRAARGLHTVLAELARGGPVDEPLPVVAVP